MVIEAHRNHHPEFFLQTDSFPVRCRNSSGRTRLLGTVRQIDESVNTQEYSEWTEIRLSNPKQTISPRNRRISATRMNRIILKALCLVGSTFPWFLPISLGLLRVKTQRADRQQKRMTNIQTAKDDRNKAMGKFGKYNSMVPTQHKDFIQTRTLQMFLIQIPCLLLSCMYLMGKTTAR